MIAHPICSTGFLTIVAMSCIVCTEGETVPFAFSTAFPILLHTSSSQSTTVCAASSRVSTDPLIFPVRTILYSSVAFFSASATMFIFPLGVRPAPRGAIARHANTFVSEVRSGAVMVCDIVLFGSFMSTFLPAIKAGFCVPSIPSAIASSDFVTSHFAALPTVPSASHVAFEPCAAHLTSASAHLISACVTFAAHFNAASAILGDAFTHTRFNAHSAVNQASLMSCFTGSLCELYHSCAFANHAFAKSFTTCGVSIEAAGAMLHSIA